jgi:uncharacterized protein (DUF2267 family)
MSAGGLDVFDRTLRTTHGWLDELGALTGRDRPAAWHLLGAVLRTLRDRITLDQAAQLGAELPLLVRGAFYDGWHPAAQPERYRTKDAFLDHVAAKLGPGGAVAPQEAAKAVFHVLTRHVSDGQIAQLRGALPEEIRTLWPDLEPGEEDPLGANPVTAQPERARHLRT